MKTVEVDMATYQFTSAFGKDLVVDANGAVITLAEGQTKLPFALVQMGEVTSDASASLSASYTGQNGSATSNAWGVNLSDAGADAKTYIGDQRAAIAINNKRLEYYDWAQTAWQADGTLIGGVSETNFNNFINASAAGSNGSVMHGYDGKDALSASLGRDDIFGDEGDGEPPYKRGTSEQRGCCKKHSAWGNEYEGYCPKYCLERSFLPGHMPGLWSSLPRAAGNEALQ